MRDIVFRGKAVDSGEWVYGSYVEATEALTRRLVSLIIPKRGDVNPDGNFPAVEIVPHTVGQYTGLRDKNGVRIFEGDIVRCEGCFTGAYNALVEFFNSAWTLTNPHMPADTMFPSELMEVIGNIHDNPK